ncbi:MAG TPA: hypothetical protein VMZ91_08085, partial [Candidatus Paceibacterota bacterium]|nr:hypothetical protein [Candidatus Paceibacterota bacterium]
MDNKKFDALKEAFRMKKSMAMYPNWDSGVYHIFGEETSLVAYIQCKNNYYDVKISTRDGIRYFHNGPGEEP